MPRTTSALAAGALAIVALTAVVTLFGYQLRARASSGAVAVRCECPR